MRGRGGHENRTTDNSVGRVAVLPGLAVAAIPRPTVRVVEEAMMGATGKDRPQCLRATSEADQAEGLIYPEAGGSTPPAPLKQDPPERIPPKSAELGEQNPPGSSWAGSFVVMRKRRITELYGEWTGPQKRTCRYRRCQKPFIAKRWWAEFCCMNHRAMEHMLEKRDEREKARQEIHRAVDAALGLED